METGNTKETTNLGDEHAVSHFHHPITITHVFMLSSPRLVFPCSRNCQQQGVEKFNSLMDQTWVEPLPQSEYRINILWTFSPINILAFSLHDTASCSSKGACLSDCNIVVSDTLSLQKTNKHWGKIRFVSWMVKSFFILFCLCR